MFRTLRDDKWVKMSLMSSSVIPHTAPPFDHIFRIYCFFLLFHYFGGKALLSHALDRYKHVFMPTYMTHAKHGLRA